MKKYKTAIILLMFVVLKTSCQLNNKKMEENNKIAIKWDSLMHYPNGKIAYKKEKDIISFYSPVDSLLSAEINIISCNSLIYNQDILNTSNLVKITKFKYFSPKEYSENYSFPLGDVGTGVGDFYTHVEYNELGLIINIRIQYPEDENKYLYHYNKYGQLLKIVEDKFIDKTLLENKYDEKSRLTSTEQKSKDTKSKKIFYYDEKNFIIKQVITIDNLTYTLLFEYNTKGELSKKYSEDKNYYFEYSYDKKGTLIKELEYKASTDKNRAKEITNIFLETGLEYDIYGNLVNETVTKYKYQTKTKRINEKWVELSLEEQKKESWILFKTNDIHLKRETVITKYEYKNTNLTNSYKNVFKNESDGHEFHSIEQTQLKEKIKYTYNSLGQIIKKEVFEEGKSEPKTVQDYFY